jgi:putative transposase
MIRLSRMRGSALAMARANRYYLPGQIWHLTHRCHKREFLLKFACDRQAWIDWLFEARKRFGLIVLDYMVTSNHVHLMVQDREGRKVIPESVQLVAGRSGQEYNQRKKRGGAFWEDRYHATAVESGQHFRQCLAYIDLNMVRAGVVTHPEQWADCGYLEIQHPKARYRNIDYERLMELMGTRDIAQLQQVCRQQIESELAEMSLERQSQWSESLAVGSSAYVEMIQKKLGVQAKGREILPVGAGFQLREKEASYRPLFDGEKGYLSLENMLFWDLSNDSKTS